MGPTLVTTRTALPPEGVAAPAAPAWMGDGTVAHRLLCLFSDLLPLPLGEGRGEGSPNPTAP